MKPVKRTFDHQLITKAYLTVELLFCVTIKIVSVLIYNIIGFPLSVCCIVYYCVYRGKRGAYFAHYCLTAIIIVVTIMYNIQLIYKISVPSTLLNENLLLAILYILWTIIHLLASFSVLRKTKRKQ